GDSRDPTDRRRHAPGSESGLNLRISHPPARGRAPVITDADIRHAARTLLVEHGADAVTLRAIARSLGVTAPALYRYYKSLDDLMESLRLEICADLAAELSDRIAELPDDG